MNIPEGTVIFTPEQAAAVEIAIKEARASWTDELVGEIQKEIEKIVLEICNQKGEDTLFLAHRDGMNTGILKVLILLSKYKKGE